jgi:uncharacterized membrane protein
LDPLIARNRKLLNDVSEAFWVIPGLMVLAGVVAAYVFVRIDHIGAQADPLLEEAWLYRGGPAGARAVLAAIASSTIAVAGTVFSITIAALSLASGQMGPRLLRNFTRDRGNQITLGAFIGTFVYALMVLRTVRSPLEREFVPHLSLTIAILLAFVCVATLVWFVAHMAQRINVDTVIDLVSCDVHAGIDRMTVQGSQPPPPAAEFWRDATPIIDRRSGYLQQLDVDNLADWVFQHHAALRLLVRPGDYVFPNTPIAIIKPRIEGAGDAILKSTALGAQRRGDIDLDYTVAQMVEVAVRALASGVNDPQTAISVLDRLGAALCKLSGVQLANGVTARHDRPVLVVPLIDYEGLLSAMLQMIRQNAAGKPPVLNKILQVLTAVAGCERDPARIAALRSHADRVLADAERSVPSPSDLDEVRKMHAKLVGVLSQGAAAVLVHSA